MIAIIKYNAGNIQSVQNALNRLGYDSVITDDADTILNAQKVIFPGVGEASSAMQYLNERGLDEVIKSITQPFLGICLGLQLMCNKTEEGDTKCLGIFDTDVKLFPPDEKVPHMGWNNFETLNGKLLKGLNLEDDVYYVHSYYAEICKATVASCDYIKPFSAALQKNNFYATQFHPEKSADVGEQILKTFCTL
jgi:imidazole glycerol-phosphate synthase subunit HisH